MASVPEEFQVRRAERQQARLRLALAAASGGGKTASALIIARGICEEALARGLISGTLEGKIGVVDTERQSAALYSHLVPFDIVPLNKPYSVARYGQAMSALEQAGVYVMIVDSISHGWVGDGGVLALLNSLEAHERFSGFNTTVNPAQDEFVDRILRSPCHVIVTMRSKTSWVLEQVEKTRRNGGAYTTTVPRRIGMKPIQRDGIEFEFTTLLDLDTETHHAAVVKNRCTVFDGWQPQKLTVETGRALLTWMQEGAPTPEEPVPGTPEERANAVVAAALRAMERASTLPDLARVLTDADTSVKGFVSVLGKEFVAGLRAQLAAAKDARKEVLRPGSGAPVPDVLGPDITAALEAVLQGAGVDLAKALAYLEVPTLRALPKERLQGFISWVDTMAQTPDQVPLPAALTALGLKWPSRKFDDLVDDIPF